jgi:hypothetical protein
MASTLARLGVLAAVMQVRSWFKPLVLHFLCLDEARHQLLTRLARQ